MILQAIFMNMFHQGWMTAYLNKGCRFSVSYLTSCIFIVKRWCISIRTAVHFRFWKKRNTLSLQQKKNFAQLTRKTIASNIFISFITHDTWFFFYNQELTTGHKMLDSSFILHFLKSFKNSFTHIDTFQKERNQINCK